MHCENPHYKEHIKNFLRKYPTAKGRVPDAIIVVDPKYWYISDNPKVNTVRCCQVCSIQEDIELNRRNGPDRACSCQWEIG